MLKSDLRGVGFRLGLAAGLFISLELVCHLFLFVVIRVVSYVVIVVIRVVSCDWCGVVFYVV